MNFDFPITQQTTKAIQTLSKGSIGLCQVDNLINSGMEVDIKRFKTDLKIEIA